jgi:hypothetical protein
MMMSTLKVVAIGFCALLSSPLVASAATVSTQGGTVLVSEGDGFVPISGQAKLAPGGRVMVRPGGVATIAYNADCTVRVGSGVWLVQTAAPCKPGTTMIDFTGRMHQQPPADPPADPPVDPPTEDPPGGLTPTTGLIIGGVVVGGIVLGLTLGQSSEDRPASP